MFTTTDSTIATDLAANMLGLLVNGPNAPIQRMIREGLIADPSRALGLRDSLAEHGSSEVGRDYDARQVAEIVATYVGAILHDTIRDAQHEMHRRNPIV